MTIGSQLRRMLTLLRGRSGFAAVVQTGFATTAVLMINVITGVISARMLGPQGRGELSALLLCPQFLSFLFTLGLPAALIVKMQQEPEAARGLLGAGIALSLIMGLAATVAGVAFVPRLLAQYGAHAILTARLLMGFVLTGVLSTVLMAALQIRDRFDSFNRIRFYQSLLVLAGLLALAAAGMFTPTSGALAYSLPALPFILWAWLWVRREFSPTLQGFRDNARRLLSYGLRAHGSDAVSTLLAQVDKVVLVPILTPGSFGIYVVAFNLSRLVTTFGFAAAPVLLPKSAGKPMHEVLAMTGRTLAAVLILTAAAVLGFALFGGLALRVLYGHDFDLAHWALLLLSVEAAFSGTAYVLQQPYMVANRPGAVVIMQSLGLMVTVALLAVLSSRMGINGAAAAVLIGTSVRLLCTWGGYRPLLGVGAPPLVPRREDWSLLLQRLRMGTP
ncbi:MAG: oligosaccharide flippase family protein [Proteobacteria bacterium]|nr:oligosaccharide flippase family protein [Pseudomonadota bacterium]